MTIEDAPLAVGSQVRSGGAETIDAYLRHWAHEQPDAVAIVDAPNRAELGLGPARVLTYAALHAAADRIAGRFRALGFEPGDVVALQIPNICEWAEIALGALRAGLAVSPLPLLWRQSEIVNGCSQVAPIAIVTIAHFAGHNHAETMCEAAAKVISVRFVLGFGEGLPDGVTDIADWMDAEAAVDDSDGPRQTALGGDRIALLTWGAASCSGAFAVPRTHRELLALGRAVARRLDFSGRETILSAYPLSTLTAAGGLVLPWLVTGAKLVLHLPFEFDVFLRQLAGEKVTFTAIPSPLLKALDEGRHYAREALHLKRVACVWPAVAAPRGKQRAEPVVPTFDMRNINEVGLALCRRRPGRDPTLLPLGKLRSHSGADADTVYLETRLRGSVRAGVGHQDTLTGELRLRGPTVPRGPFNAAGKIAQVFLRPDHYGFVGTRIQCAVDAKDMVHVRCQGSANFIQHGGVTISADELDALYQEFPDFLDAAALAIDDPVMGSRVLAAIVPRPNISPSLDEFRRYLREKQIAAYKFPDQLVVVDTIPRGSDGKIERGSILSHI